MSIVICCLKIHPNRLVRIEKWGLNRDVRLLSVRGRGKGSREGPDDKVETFNPSNVETFRIQAQYFRGFF